MAGGSQRIEFSCVNADGYHRRACRFIFGASYVGPRWHLRTGAFHAAHQVEQSISSRGVSLPIKEVARDRVPDDAELAQVLLTRER
jgi:hypothetical protein